MLLSDENKLYDWPACLTTNKEILGLILSTNTLSIFLNELGLKWDLSL